MLPPAPRNLFAADKMWVQHVSIYAKHLSVSTKQTINIVPICVDVEQRRTHDKYCQ